MKKLEKAGLVFLLLLTVANFVSTGFILNNVGSFDVSNVKEISLKSAIIISVLKYICFSLFVGICYYNVIRTFFYKSANHFSKIIKGIVKCFILISVVTICGSILISVRQQVFTPALLKRITNIAIIDGIIFFVPIALITAGVRMHIKSEIRKRVIYD